MLRRFMARRNRAGPSGIWRGATAADHVLEPLWRDLIERSPDLADLLGAESGEHQRHRLRPNPTRIAGDASQARLGGILFLYFFGLPADLVSDLDGSQLEDEGDSAELQSAPHPPRGRPFRQIRESSDDAVAARSSSTESAWPAFGNTSQ